MILLDDIIAAPGKGLMWVFRSIHKAVEEQMANEKTETKAHLSELYTQLERGEISEEEFEQQEALLLDRLDQMEEQKQ